MSFFLTYEFAKFKILDDYFGAFDRGLNQRASLLDLASVHFR